MEFCLIRLDVTPAIPSVLQADARDLGDLIYADAVSLSSMYEHRHFVFWLSA